MSNDTFRTPSSRTPTLSLSSLWILSLISLFPSTLSPFFRTHRTPYPILVLYSLLFLLLLFFLSFFLSSYFLLYFLFLSILHSLSIHPHTLSLSLSSPPLSLSLSIFPDSFFEFSLLRLLLSVFQFSSFNSLIPPPHFFFQFSLSPRLSFTHAILLRF